MSGREHEWPLPSALGAVGVARSALGEYVEAQPRLLIVDSDVATRESLARALARLGFVVEVVGDFATAFGCIRAGVVEMLIVDPSHWPGSTYDLCGQIRSEGDVAILIVTTLQIGLQLANISAAWQLGLIGILLIASVSSTGVFRRFREARS